MKLIKLILFFVIGGTLFGSCKKCVTCSYAAPGVPAYSSKYCSKRSKDIEAFKKSVSVDAQRYGTTSECVDN
jgi:hypothetical protein